MTLGLAAVHARVAEIQSRFPVARPTAPATTSRSFGATLDRELSADRPVGGRAVSGEHVVAAAKRYLGVPYVWGGTDPSKGLDCSGLVQRVYGEFGYDLPRVSRDQARAGRPVASLAEARPGDLVAFGSPVDHIGIYAGNGKMVVAPHRGEVVRVEDIGDRRPTAIRRILPDEPLAGIQGVAGGTIGIGGLGGPGAAAPAGAPGATYRPLFEEAGARHGVPPELLEAVARAESGFNPRAVSRAGALGLMQIMPSTARGLNVDPLDPAQAVDGAARLLASHLDRFGTVELALAAYNAGPNAVARHGGIPPYSETRTYVQRVMSYLQEGA